MGAFPGLSPLKRSTKCSKETPAVRVRRPCYIRAGNLEAMSFCVCNCLSRRRRRRGYKNLDEESTQGSLPHSPIQESTGPDKESLPQSQFRPDKERPGSPCKPIEESAVVDQDLTEPLQRPIEESTFSSDSFTIGSKGLVLSRRKESGYALRIPKGSLPNDKVAIKVDAYYPVSKPHFIPERSELVSGVCHIDSKEIELRKSGFLVIDHCMDVRNAEDRDSVGVVTHKRRRENNTSGSHQFQYVDDSDIDVRSDCVEVKLRKLGSVYYAAVCAEERRGGVGYCGLLYREAVVLSCTKFYFMVVKDLFFYVKVCILATNLHATDLVHIHLHRQYKRVVLQGS